MTKAMASSTPSTTDKVDKLFRQLMEIDAIGTAQTKAPVPPLAHFGLGPAAGPDGMPSTTTMAPPPPTDFIPKFYHSAKAHLVSHWHADKTVG
jgi:hypothetical protein